MAKSWEQVRRESAVNETRVATYRSLSEAEQRIADGRHREGVSWKAIEEALAGSELSNAELETEDDIYLASLARFVAALGGHLEVRAVFAEETITVRRDPEPNAD